MGIKQELIPEHLLQGLAHNGHLINIYWMYGCIDAWIERWMDGWMGGMAYDIVNLCNNEQ